MFSCVSTGVRWHWSAKQKTWILWASRHDDHHHNDDNDDDDRHNCDDQDDHHHYDDHADCHHCCHNYTTMELKFQEKYDNVLREQGPLEMDDAPMVSNAPMLQCSKATQLNATIFT